MTENMLKEAIYMKNYPSRRNNDFGPGWFDNAFDDFFRPFYDWDRAPGMKTDIQEKDGSYLLEIDMPGYDKKDINVSLEDGYLTVSAKTSKNIEEKGENKSYIRRERCFGSCSRSFYVGDVDQKDISASYDNGILNISFPKSSKQIEKKKNIDIK